MLCVVVGMITHIGHQMAVCSCWTGEALALLRTVRVCPALSRAILRTIAQCEFKLLDWVPVFHFWLFMVLANPSS